MMLKLIVSVLVFIATAQITQLNAAYTFKIENPETDFSITDASPYDGLPDLLTEVFGSVGRGHTGEERSGAEFPLNGIPGDPTWLVSAFFQVKVLEKDVSGYGVSGITPDVLSLFCYVGNGIAELSDYGIPTKS
ncbi:MAG: hypothetical protein ACK52I_08910 [Pseudomonadota bacterium]|jgi:hypothetical protein